MMFCTVFSFYFFLEFLLIYIYSIFNLKNCFLKIYITYIFPVYLSRFQTILITEELNSYSPKRKEVKNSILELEAELKNAENQIKEIMNEINLRKNEFNQKRKLKWKA